MQLFKNKVQSRQKLTETYSMCAPISVHHAWRQLYGVSQSECGVLNNVTGYVFYPLITVIWHFTVNNNTDMLFLNSYLTVGWRMRWTSTVATVTQCSTLFLQPTRDYIHNRAADTEQQAAFPIGWNILEPVYSDWLGRLSIFPHLYRFLKRYPHFMWVKQCMLKLDARINN